MKKQLMILALCSAPLIFGMETIDIQADGACPMGPDHQADGSMCLKSPEPETYEKIMEPLTRKKISVSLRHKSLPVALRHESLPVELRPETPQEKFTTIHHDLCALWQEIDPENSKRAAGDRQQIVRALWSLQNTDIFLSLPQEQRESLSTQRYALFGYETSSK